MKVPKVFKPDNIEEKTNSLLNPLKKLELEDLILREDSGFPKFISQKDFPAEDYSSLDPSKLDQSKMEKGIYVDYGSPGICIIKFKDKQYLFNNTEKVKDLVKEYNSYHTFTKNLSALVKDEYVIFLYAESKHPRNYASQEAAEFKTKAIKFYKEKLGFEEVE